MVNTSSEDIGLDLIGGLPFQKVIDVGQFVLLVWQFGSIARQLDIYQILPCLQVDPIAIVLGWCAQVLWLGTGICLLLSRRDHGKGSVESIDCSSLTTEVVSQGDNILLQQGDFVIGGLELPLHKEEVGPHLHYDLVRGFDDIDDFPPIGAQAVGIAG